jgi:hypothetical protein
VKSDYEESKGFREDGCRSRHSSKISQENYRIKRQTSYEKGSLECYHYTKLRETLMQNGGHCQGDYTKDTNHSIISAHLEMCLRKMQVGKYRKKRPAVRDWCNWRGNIKMGPREVCIIRTKSELCLKFDLKCSSSIHTRCALTLFCLSHMVLDHSVHLYLNITWFCAIHTAFSCWIMIFWIWERQKNGKWK